MALEDVRQQLERKQVQLQDAGHHGQEREILILKRQKESVMNSYESYNVIYESYESYV